MIPGFSTIRLIVWGIAAAAVISIFIYGKVVYNRAERVPELEQKIGQLIGQLETERTQVTQALERENAIQKKLAAAYAGSADLAARLRRAYTARLSKTPPVATEPERTAGVGSSTSEAELDLAVAGIIGSCKADSIRLGEFQRWHESIPAELK